MNDWVNWALGIAAVLISAAVIAAWKEIAGKADRTDLGEAVVKLDNDIKSVSLRVDRSFAVIAQAVSKTDLIEKMSSVTTRADDKDIRVQHDITELKSDMKSLSEKLAAVDKKLDELPTRVASLEQTRNQERRNE